MTTYQDVNAAWSSAFPLPPVTNDRAKRVAWKLWQKFVGRGKPYPMRWRHYLMHKRSWGNPKPVASGERENGLQYMVHDISHAAHEHLHAGKLKSHSVPHAALERAMIEHVIAKGWHLSQPAKPKARPTTEESKSAELSKVMAAIKRWSTKAKRADTALKKLERKRKRLGTAILMAGG